MVTTCVTVITSIKNYSFTEKNKRLGNRREKQPTFNILDL